MLPHQLVADPSFVVIISIFLTHIRPTTPPSLPQALPPFRTNSPASIMSTTNQPNPTLYINNLNDKVHKEELRSQLHALFSTYGKLLDVVALKTAKMRGQAFLVFSDLASATAAMRACEGMMFYDKPLVRSLLSRRAPCAHHLVAALFPSLA
jgi:RNA recognition motif-containing protein